jgi:hypothetical protein
MFNLNIQRQTPESYAQKLKEALPGSLKSVILFGSAASGEHVEGKSDYNLLVIVDKWGILELNQVAKVTQGWIKEGNPPPLLFTPDRLQASADCFPIEMLDMKQSYRVVLGEDLLKDVKVQSIHLRLMTEREIKSLKIQLRQGFIYAEGKPQKVSRLMEKTLSTSLVLFRAALRLFSKAVPAKKYEVLPAIAEFVKGVDVDAFLTIRKLKDGELKPSRANVLQLFERYMTSIVAVGDAVDNYRGA